MRIKLMSGLVMLLLTATSAYPQEISPLIVETLRTTTPTAVKTAEPFVQVYRVTFIDFSADGTEIVIKEDTLNPGKFGEFDVVDLRIDKRSIPGSQFLMQSWDLVYTFKIINQKKGDKVIPQITIPWVRKEQGKDVNDPSLPLRTHIKTEPVHINYVTTVPEGAEQIAIRDEQDLGNFENQELAAGLFAWFMFVVPGIVWIWMLGGYIRTPRAKADEKVTQKDKYPGIHDESLSMRKAFKDLHRSIKKLRDIGSGTEIGNDIPGLMAELARAIRKFLQAQEPAFKDGTTPNEMHAYLKNSRKKDMLVLAEKAVLYQTCLESGYYLNWPSNPVEDADELRRALNRFSWPHRFLDSIVSIPGKTWNKILRRNNA